MQSLITLLLQLSGKAWTVIVVAVFCGGAATVFYFSSANAGSNSTAGGSIVTVQTGRAGDFGHSTGGDHCGASLPVVPEANAGMVLIPVVAAMLLVSSRRLWDARRTLVADGQDIKGTS